MNGESFIVTMQTGGIPLFLPCVTIALVAVFVAVYSVRSILKNEELRTWFLAALLVLAVPTAPLVLYNSMSVLDRAVGGDSLQSRPEILEAVAQRYGAKDLERVDCPDNSSLFNMKIGCVTYDGGKTIVRVSFDHYRDKDYNTSDYLVTVTHLTSSKEMTK